MLLFLFLWRMLSTAEGTRKDVKWESFLIEPIYKNSRKCKEFFRRD